MLPTRSLPGLMLLIVLAGCATQSAQGDDGLGNDVPTKPEDSGEPTVDVTVPDMDSGQPDDSATDPDTGSKEADTGTPITDRGGNVTDTQVARDEGLPTDRGTANCAAQSNCTACTAFPSCGWCAVTGRCVDGTATGPVGGTCAMGWAWIASACTSVDPCAASTTCTTCATQAGCGWCGATGRCVTANTADTGPATGVCASAWAGTTAACTVAPPDPCNANTDCYSCGQASACGWCRATNRCMTGTSTGPNPIYGACTNWAFLSSQCTPAVTDPCRTSNGDCSSCVGRSQCGFCRDTNTCHTGSSGGPTDRACRSGRWYWDPFLGICFS